MRTKIFKAIRTAARRMDALLEVRLPMSSVSGLRTR
jgi:hypothetical protein